jgi:hypothetical protein
MSKILLGANMDDSMFCTIILQEKEYGFAYAIAENDVTWMFQI